MPDCKVAVGIVTLNRPDCLDRCLQAVFEQRELEPSSVYLLQNGPKVAVQIERASRAGAKVSIPEKNLGLPAGWNFLLRWAFAEGHDAVLLLNDDLYLRDAETVRIVREIFRLPRQMRYLHGRGFSAVVISKAVWDEVGEFDEGFFPAFFEDNDHHRRQILAGVPWEEIGVATDHEGSATLVGQIRDLNAMAFPKNAERYRAKWGNGPGQEVYETPWNGGEPWPSTRETLPADVVEAIEAPYA